MNMTFWKRMLFSILLAAGTLLPGVSPDELTPEGRSEYESLQALREWVKQSRTRFTENVNTRKPVLADLYLLENTKIDGEKIIRYTPEQRKALKYFFGYVMRFHGDLKLYASHDGRKWWSLGHWWSNRDGSQGKYRGGTWLKIAGKGTVEFLLLRAINGVSLEFDMEPYSIPGKDEPVLPVSVRIDLRNRLSFSGDSSFQRRKWMRLYNMPDSIAQEDYRKASEYFVPRGFAGGRDAGFSITNDPAKQVHRNLPLLKQLKAFYPEPLMSVVCFASMPKEVQCRDPKLANTRSTPAVDQFQKTAELIAATIAQREQSLGEYAGGYCEVKNESDIGTNWAYFNNTGKYDPWKLLADFHNAVAKAVKARNPGWKVGGPSSCLPVLDAGRFQRGRAMLKFAERTYPNLDYYSWHFYERNVFRLSSPGVYGHTYLFGKLDAALDLYRNHLRLLGGEKPLVVTEYGNMDTVGTEIGFWMNLRSINALMVNMMQYPEIIPMAMPFIVPVSWWSKKNPKMDAFQLFRYDKDGNMHLTPNRHLLDLWEGVDGIRIPAETPVPNVRLVAVRSGKKVFLAVSNLTLRRVRLNLEAVSGSAKVVSASQRRLYIEKGKIHFRTDPVADLKAVPLAFDETSVLILDLDSDPGFRGTLERKIAYGDRILLPTGSGQTVTLRLEKGDLNPEKCVLRIGLWRMDGFRRNASATVNGKTFSLPLAQTAGKGSFFAPVELVLPKGILRKENTVALSIPDRDGLIVSTAFYSLHQRNE